MSYNVNLKDNRSYVLSDENGKDLQRKWMQSGKPFTALLGEDTVLSSLIRSISKVRVTEADRVKDGQRLLEGCIGQYSIQQQVNNIIRERHQLDWKRKIQELKYREQIRAELRSETAEWCDYRHGDCACERSYRAHRPSQFDGML